MQYECFQRISKIFLFHFGVRSVMVCGVYEKCKLDLRFIDDTWHNFLPGQEHYTN